MALGDRFERFLCTAFSMVSVLTLAAAKIEAGEADCRVVPGHVEFRGLEVDPPNPRAGDVVYLSFDIVASVHLVSWVDLYGAGGLLHGITRRDDPRFILHSLGPGRVKLNLGVVYETEEYCEVGGYFRPGPLLTATSPTYDVMIGEPLPTETATATPVPVTPSSTPTDSPPRCPGDCNGDRRVDVSELTTAVSIHLGRSGGDCAAADANSNGLVTVSELIAAVTSSLHGCAGA